MAHYPVNRNQVPPQHRPIPYHPQRYEARTSARDHQMVPQTPNLHNRSSTDRRTFK